MKKLNILKPARKAEVGNCKERFSINLFEQVKIQTNNLCTRKCQYCLYGSDINEQLSKSELLSEKIVIKLINELSVLNFSGRLCFYEINEPLTDSRIFDFIGYATKKVPNAWQSLVTNGDLLEKNSLEKLYKAGLDQLCVSIYDKPTLKKINLLKLDYPRFSKILNLMRLEKGPFSDNRGGNITYKDARSPEKPLNVNCERIKKIIYVRPNGNVVSCFSDFYEVNIMGNVYSDTLKNIWLGEKFERFRKELNNGNRSYSKLCSKCNYPGIGGYYRSFKKHI